MAGENTQADKEALQRRWIAQALGESHRSLSLFVTGSQAGGAQGALYYRIGLKGIEVAISQDGLRACLLGMPAEEAIEEVTELLRGHGLQEIRIEQGDETSPVWIEVSRGQAPVPARATRLAFCQPGQLEQVLEAAELHKISVDLLHLLLPDAVDRGRLEESHALAALPGQVVGRFAVEEPGAPGQDVFGRPLHPPLTLAQSQVYPGPGIVSVPPGEWQTEGYGYLCMVENQLSVVSPIHLPADELHAYWVVLDRQPHAVSAEMILQCLQDQGVVAGIAEERIGQLANLVRRGTCKRGMYIVAQGTSPDPGQEAQLEILAKSSSKGRSLVAFAEAVQPDQMVARRTPYKPGTPGRDVKGRPVLPPADTSHRVKAGKGVRVERDGEVECFIATAAGTLKLANDELSVSSTPLLSIDKDVGLTTGNLQFQGDVSVAGSVQRGFSVKATGDILIGGQVEEGCVVATRGSISIGGGVLGRRTKVVAQGSVQALFVEDATMAAGRNILVERVNRGRLRAGNRVMISGRGEEAGTVVGGQVWALRRIDLSVAGSPEGALTSLAVGTNMAVGVTEEQAEKLDRMQRFLEQSSRQMAQLLERIGISRIDPVQIRSLLQAASEQRRKVLLHYTRQLGRLAQLHQQVLNELQIIEEQINKVGELEIRVRDRIYPGVNIRLGSHQINLEEVHRAVRFRVVGGELREEDL
ncbi:MAG: DUF342 domain-containing protein [Candidatus Latescibacteria bacterium]|nr:DUF342 domain-containing protein [Candidatus Latescibacterota bacterium]